MKVKTTVIAPETIVFKAKCVDIRLGILNNSPPCLNKGPKSQNPRSQSQQWHGRRGRDLGGTTETDCPNVPALPSRVMQAF